jgi:hypothetical protein
MIIVFPAEFVVAVIIGGDYITAEPALGRSTPFDSL